MSYRGFRRGKGYGPRGTRAKGPFVRHYFPRAPFRHAVPPRPGHPAFMPWQPNNGFYQPQLLHANQQFGSHGRGRRIYNHDEQYIDLNNLPTLPDREKVVVQPPPLLPLLLPPPGSPKTENNQINNVPQVPLLGSEEERQQKITETADRLKQKLSSFNSDEVTDVWNDDVPLPSDTVEDGCIESRGIPELRYEPPELNLTYSDLKDIGRINPNNSKLDTLQHTTDIFSVNLSSKNNEISLDESIDVCELEVIPSHKITDLEILPDNNECIEEGKWEHHESSDNPNVVEQSDLCEDNIEKELLESDIQSQCDTLGNNVLQKRCDLQQDIVQETEIHSIDVMQGQNTSKALQNIPFPTDLTDKDISRKDMPQSETESVTNLEVQEAVLNSRVHTKSSNSNNRALSQSPLADTLISNNVMLDNHQLPKTKGISFHNGPPKLSPHTERELPIDFDPSTPPPILLKQDQPCTSSPFPVYDLPLLFDPTEPPPNMRHLLQPKMSHKNMRSIWNVNTENQAAFKNRDVHTGLNKQGVFQQLPLEISSQTNNLLPSHTDTISFPPLFPMSSSGHSRIETNVPLALPRTQQMSHNTYAASSSAQKSSPFSGLHCNMNKDDGLNDMQEAMIFANQMTSITEKKDEESNSMPLSKNCILIQPVNDIESISLPPEKPKTRAKLERKRDDKYSKKLEIEEHGTMDYKSSEEAIVQDVHSKPMDMSLMDEQDRPKVIFNLSNKTRKGSSVWQQNASTKKCQKRNGITQSIESEETYAAPSVVRQNVENTIRCNEAEEDISKKNGNSSESTVLSNFTNTTSPYKKIQRYVCTESFQHPSVLSYQRNSTLKPSGSHVEKDESSNSEISWKNQIIGRFLKMTKNEIYNMVNNTSRRKFDIIMKRLVKEKRSTLSLEMRHAQDEKMRLYDQHEFMKQLNAMLEPDATVAITDLPNEFIHHLNEVLQLHVLPNNHIEQSVSSSTSPLEDLNDMFNPIMCNAAECANEITSSEINQECTRNKSHATRTAFDKDIQTRSIRINDFNTKDDACSTKSNRSSTSSKLSILQHDLDDIFLEVTRKNQTPTASMRKDCIADLRNANKSDDSRISKNAQKETYLEDDRSCRSENCARWVEKCDKWKRKDREDPYTYRNLTKEEWEAMHGMQVNSMPSSSVVKKTGDDKNLSNKIHARNPYKRRRHSSESSKLSNIRHKTMENDKRKQSRRHSDERKQTASYSEDSSSSNYSTSSSSSSSSSSSDSSDRREPNVTKLLRVIKEKEKVAKKMSLNETIRDEVNAEIERERKQKRKKLHKNRKSNKHWKEKREHHERNKKQTKKVASSSDRSPQDNGTEASRLLMENEIKKERIEDQVMQEVLIKEELDIGQDENTVDAVFTSPSSHCADIENKVTSLHTEFQDEPESPLVREISMMTANTIESYAEDKLASSPTQPKTKAQLKQMPETAGTDDNKVSLNMLSSLVTEDQSSMINSTNMSECLENPNKDYQASEVSYNEDKTEIHSVINNLTSQGDNVDNNVQVSHNRSDKNLVQQSDATLCVSTELPGNLINIPNNNENAVDISNITSTVIASTSSVSGVSITSTTTQRQGTNRKIDIKTYYERTVQRRMNEQGESKKLAEESTETTQNFLPIPKAVDVEVTTNSSISTHSSSTKHPRLAKSAAPHYASNKDDIAQVKSREYIQQDSNKAPEVAGLALKYSEGSSVVNAKSAIKRIDKCKSEGQVLQIADTNINILSNVVTTSKIITQKSKKLSKAEADVTSRKPQDKILADPRKFKNIRSEGGKELKLKKDIAKTQKAKKKSVIASKSASLISTKKHSGRTAAENIEKIIQEEEMDNINDVSKINIEWCTQAINSYSSKINNNNTEMELAKISSKSADNHNSESPHDIDEIKERSSEPKLIESRNIEEDTRNTNAYDQLSITTMQNEEACNIEHRNDTPSVEIANEENQDTRQISNVVPESGMFTDPTIPNPEIKSSSNNDETSKEELSLMNENQQPNIKDMELSLNQAQTNEIQAEKLKKQDLLGSMNIPASIEKCDVNFIPETYVISRLNAIDTQGELHDIYRPGSKNETKEITELPTPNKHSQGKQGIENDVASPDSIGSPFKGFLQESVITFEQPNLLNIELDEIGANKENKLLSDNCSVSCIIDTENCKEMEIERQRDYETPESITDYANDISINANEICNITFGDALLSSDKNANEKTDKSDSIADENRERSIEKSSSDIVTTTLHEDNNINSDENSETEKQLIIEEKYTSNTELEVKGAVFINEEETLQDENRSKDFTDKLTTITDPSLSDALDTAASDETLKLSEIQTAEQLDNHVYLETNISPEKISCDKSPGFDTDEHLDNMFYLDIRLQSTTTFDSKDDGSAHFSDDRPSPQCEITPIITPETTTIMPCSDSSHDETQQPEQCEFNFKHISPMDTDCNLLTKTSLQHSPIDTPRILNIPTKAALKETARNLFLKSPNDMSTATKEDGISEKMQQDGTVAIYQTPAWHLNIHKNTETHPQGAQSNTLVHDITTVNTVSSTQCSADDVLVNTDVSISQSVSLAPSDVHYSTVYRNPVIELEKMKELDNGREKETEKISEKIESTINRNRKRLKGSILHKLKDNQRMKHRSRSDPSNRKILSEKLRNMKQSGKCSDNTRKAILARMLEIDMEMHKLTIEKLKLHEMLQSNAASVKSSTSNSAVLKTKENKKVSSVQPEVLLSLTSQSAQDGIEPNSAELSKHLSPSKQSPSEQRRRTISHSSEDEEIIHYTQKMKTPVIKWKKIPRLDQTIKRRDQVKENQGEKREGLTPLPTVTKTIDSSIGPSRNTVQEPNLDTITAHGMQVQQISAKNDEKFDRDIDKSAKSAICLSKNTVSQQLEPQDPTERESDNTEHFLIQQSSNVDEKNEFLAPSEAARINCQSNMQAHGTPEPSSIYSDDSTWDSLVQNTVSEMHEKRKSTGLALLEETFKKELAISRKMKAVARKQKKKQLNNFLKSVNSLTIEEEDLPLSKLYIRKLQQKRDLLDSLSQRKVDVAVDPKILDNMEEVINAVAENRVEDLYESQSEARASNDIPTTSKVSSISQPEGHQFYMDVETNANSDWPCQEKENIEEIALQRQNSDNVSDESSRAFTAVNQDKVPVYDECNVEPDSSLTPEETLMESHSSDHEHVHSKELSDTALRNFDIRVSVPKILIQDNFNLGLLQKFGTTIDSGNANVRLVDSTTNAFNATSAKKLEGNKEGDKILRDTQPAIKPIMEKGKNEEESEMNLYEKDKYTIDANSNKRNIASCELQKQETTDIVRDAQSDVQSNIASITYSNIIENENSDDSVVSNRCDKIATTDLIRDVASSNSITKNIGTECIVQNSSKDVENKTTTKEERSNPENKSYAFKKIINSDQCMGSPLPTDSTDPASEKSEESKEMSVEKRHSPEPATTSALSFNKAIRNIETNKKLVYRRKHSKSTIVRRSTRYINESMKLSKINEADANSNSSEQDLNIHERDLTMRRKSKSPIRDERFVNILLNVRKNRGSQKAQDTNVRKVFIDAKSERNVDNPVKSHPIVFIECAASKNKIAIAERKRKQHTKWQMMNCKVRLIDCKHTLLKPDVGSEVLREFGIIIINPYVPTGILCDRNNPVNPAAILEKSSLPADNLDDKNKLEIEISEDVPIKKDNEDDLVQESMSHVVEDDEQEPVRTQYTVHKGPILDIKVFENSFLAASEDGKIYRYSQTSNGILNIYKGHKSAVTCLYIYKSDVASVNKEFMYSGSLDGTLRCYNIMTGALVKNPIQINSPIQCMDQAWGLIFIGTKSGHVSRFHIKTGVIKGSSIQFSDKSVLALKTTNEGPRKILIVASRNQPITIRDAQTGLFLRTISGQKNHTVYSLMRHHNLIYCGTSSTSINVFDFTTGEQAVRYEAGVGIVCMRLYEQLLFAGCYDGNIYVFDTSNHKLICSISGPGNMLLSIEVVHNKIIAGSKDKRLHSWQMSSQVRALLHKITQRA